MKPVEDLLSLCMTKNAISETECFRNIRKYLVPIRKQTKERAHAQVRTLLWDTGEGCIIMI